MRKCIRVWPDTNIVLLNIIYRKDKRYTDEQLTDTNTKLLLILSQCPSWIHLGEFSGENLPCKTTPRWRNLNFPPTRFTLHNLFTLEEMLNNLYSPVIFCTSSQWVSILPWWHNWDIPWCLLESSCDHSNLLCLFSWNIGLNFFLW